MSVRVVIAEDEAIIRLDLKEILQEQGYEVVAETGRGDEVVALVKQHTPDLVMLDVKMPGRDGLSVAEELSADRRAAIVILTAFSQRDLVERARDAGAVAYLVKPFEKSDLLPAIEIALGRHAELLALDAEVSDLSERLEARKVLDRAKGKLMDQHEMNESQAWRFLQSTAMDERSPVAAVAQRVLDGSLVPTQA
ncbi:MAG: response regulator [Acidimicrobiia bacterium]